MDAEKKPMDVEELTGEAVRDFLFDTIDGMADGSIDNKTADARRKLASKLIKSTVKARVKPASKLIKSTENDTPEVMAIDVRKGALDARIEAASGRAGAAMLKLRRGELTPAEAIAELKAAGAELDTCSREMKALGRELKQALQAMQK